MIEKLPRLALSACLLCPSLTWALGLGEIHLNSALNEPMNADIELLAASPEELNSLRASLASRDNFQRYGIDRPAFLTSLNFKVGRGKDGRDALVVRSSEAIPEPFVTFLVEVTWSRGRLVREYTVLLDPPVYAPGEAQNSAAPVSAPQASPTETAQSGSIVRPETPSTGVEPVRSETVGDYHVQSGDTLTGIARSLSSGNVNDQLMMAIYHANPQAFSGNVNRLRRGAVLRMPGADEIAALSQTEARQQFHQQMSAWRGSSGASPAHLKLVTPGASSAASSGDSGASVAEAQALKDRVKDLESQLSESRRLLDLRSSELAELQRKLGREPAAVAAPTPVAEPAPVAEPTAPVSTTPSEPVTEPQPVAEAPTPAPAPVVQAPEASGGSWLDFIKANWWAPAGIAALLLGGLGFAAWKRRQQAEISDFAALTATGVADPHESTSPLRAMRRTEESIVVEESGEHQRPEFGFTPEAATSKPRAAREVESKSADDTISSETAINLEQGDPLAEADFHMAYGLYDQAADLVRIAIEHEPDRRDLKLKLLEIFFVWGNKDAFLQAAKELGETKSRAAPGEWDKIVIMGKQICPDEPMFAKAVGAGMGAGALVDLNLEGGENRIDIDLYGDADPSKSAAAGVDFVMDKQADSGESTGTEEALQGGDEPLDFVLDSPERGDDSPTHEMPRRGDETTIETEIARTRETPTLESPAMLTAELSGVRQQIESKLAGPGVEQTAELALDDLGLDLHGLEDSSVPTFDNSNSNLQKTGHPLEATDHPSDAPTMIAGLDERSRRLMEEAEARVRDRDLTELERELEASFIAELDAGHTQAGIKTAILGPESAPTLQMPRRDDAATTNTARLRALELSDRVDVNSTSRLRGLDEHSIDLDLDKLASALGSGDTVEQPRAADEVFSTEVFDSSRRDQKVDLDVGVPLQSSDQSPTSTAVIEAKDTAQLPELEPVTMSEVGTKLDLARAYMDMGDPEGARSILDEVISEGSASQKQEAQRLIESLPG